MDVSGLISSRWLELSSYQFLMPLLRRQGIDLSRREVSQPLPRGVPVYVTHDADLERVQRNMARGLVRTCFVVRDESVVGAVEISDLVALADSLWPRGAGRSSRVSDRAIKRVPSAAVR